MRLTAWCASDATRRWTWGVRPGCRRSGLRSRAPVIRWPHRPFGHWAWGAVMKLLLRRDQRVSRLGKMQFVVDVRAQLNKDEQRSIQTHRFGKAVLYVKNGRADRAKGVPGWPSRLSSHAVNISISVDD